MSKKEIIGSVRIKGTLYKTGDEAALAAAASPEQIRRLTEKGVITGDFGASKSEKPVAEAVEEVAEVPAKGKPKAK